MIGIGGGFYSWYDWAKTRGIFIGLLMTNAPCYTIGQKQRVMWLFQKYEPYWSYISGNRCLLFVIWLGKNIKAMSLVSSWQMHHVIPLVKNNEWRGCFRIYEPYRSGVVCVKVTNLKVLDMSDESIWRCVHHFSLSHPVAAQFKFISISLASIRNHLNSTSDLNATLFLSQEHLLHHDNTFSEKVGWFISFLVYTGERFQSHW
jgi:hypothetical protein